MSLNKLENQLKTEKVENKALLLNNAELEKIVIELSNNTDNIGVTSLLEGKDIEIQVLRKKLKMPHDAYPQTTKLLVVQ